MAVKFIAAIQTFSGLEGDTKPTTAAVGSLFYETDSGHTYRWDTSTWNLTFPSVDAQAHGAIITIDHLGHEVHHAHHFTATNAEVLASGSVSSILLETPGSAVATICMMVMLNSSGAGTLLFAEGEVGTVGTVITPQNNHRPTAGSSTMISLTNTAAPTVGTVLEYSVIGTSSPSSKLGGGREGQNEWILEHEMRYSLQFTSSAATNVAWNLFWVEELA